MNFKKSFMRIFALSIAMGFLIGLIPVNSVTAPDPQLTIAELQGSSWSTPYYGQTVETTGIVTADYQDVSKRGFFMQDPVGDGNPYTSEGMFVYAPPWFGNFVDLGDEISIVARVTERFGLTQMDFVKSITILSTDNELPAPVELNPPADNYWSDVYYEDLEGMLVVASKMKVVMGTNKFGEVAGVRTDLGIKRVFQDDPDGTGEIIFADDAGGVVVNARSGQIVTNLYGPLDYTFGQYKVLPGTDSPPEIFPSYMWTWIKRPWTFRHYTSIATYNMLNLFDDIKDPGKLQTRSASSLWTAEEVEVKVAKHARAIHDYLREPDLIAVQEVEKVDLLEWIADSDVIKADYGAILIPGPDVRGINVGLMYRQDKVNILSYEFRQTCTNLDDGFGPDDDPDIACDEGEGPLFSRRPLVVHFETIKGEKDMWLVINHFKSKSGGDAETTPRRVEQAAFVASLVDELQADDSKAKVMVLGDLNDFLDREPITTLEDSGLRNLILDVKKKNRYTFIFEGVSEVLDHMLITPSLERYYRKTAILHFNPDFPYPLFGEDPTTGIGSSDHDIAMSFFNLGRSWHHHHWW
jgi:predicted extracellular nuclease